jgi:hypothetical protein
MLTQWVPVQLQITNKIHELISEMEGIFCQHILKHNDERHEVLSTG